MLLIGLILGALIVPLIAKAMTTPDTNRYPQPSETFGYALEARGTINKSDTSVSSESHIHASASYGNAEVIAYNGPSEAPQGSVRRLLPADEESMLAYIKDKESSGNPTAQNPSSSAYGHWGFLDSTWASVGCTKTSDPEEQERCALLYMEQRYGGIEGAYYFHLANDYY